MDDEMVLKCIYLVFEKFYYCNLPCPCLTSSQFTATTHGIHQSKPIISTQFQLKHENEYNQKFHHIHQLRPNDTRIPRKLHK